MDARKRLILKEIVDHHIRTGRAVSSQTILEKYGLSVSSATIRNDMKYLEQRGYIRKAWSSSGRIPTAKGYRFFVDWLLELSELARKQQHAILEAYAFQKQRLDELLHQTAFLLASLTGHLGFVLTPRIDQTELEFIALVKLSPDHALAVLVSDLGIVESRIIPTTLPEEQLEKIGNLLNRSLHGRRLGELAAELAESPLEGWSDRVTQDAFALVQQLITPQLARQRLYTEGLAHLLQTVFSWEDPIEEARKLLCVLEDESRFLQALGRTRTGELTTIIGEENPVKELHPYSIVSLNYGYDGVLGVLGPVRMDYSKVVSTTQYIGNRLRAILTISKAAAAWG
ncbi:MAG: heat-inducible transcriptional repressor HrcA [Candidatus Bipolaricaulota bacterium]|nr:heat-inducible transcriptional repressor HrcA [Candidatus Bipolaricaulota bacterium]MDW8031646.1 heat-inducible transcriptional repressor HrcA [Candidatus Bipolaricaulota bacterium]